MEPRCEQCKFWDRGASTGAGSGLCRRRSPGVVTGRTYPYVATRWPETSRGDWCGEGRWGEWGLEEEPRGWRRLFRGGL